MDLGGKGANLGQAIVGHKLLDALLADLMGAGNCAQIAQHHRRHAAVGINQRKGQFILFARHIEFTRRHAQPFGEDIVTFDIPAMAAHIRDMGNRPHKSDDLALPKDRRHHHTVGQMAGSQPGIIGKEHIPLLERLHRKPFQQRAGGARQDHTKVGRAKAGLADRIARLIEQDTGKIAALAHNRGERGTHGCVVDLIHDANQPLPHDLQRNRVKLGGIYRIIHHPYRSTA